MRHLLLATATASSLMLLGTGYARAITYTFSPVGPPANGPSWETFSTAYGLNNLGHVVGKYQGIKWRDDYRRESYWYVQTGNGVVPFAIPGAENMNISGINDAGQIVGTYFQTDTYPYRKSFLATGGTIQDISAPGASMTYVYDINNRGHVVGAYYDPESGEQNFLYSNGVYTDLDLPYQDGTYVRGINDAGDLVGYVTIYKGYRVRDHGFYYSNGVLRIIDVPMASQTYVTDINNLGQMVGYYQSIYDGGLYGFSFSATTGEFAYIDAPGKVYPEPWRVYGRTQTVLEGINDAGQIVGYSGDIYGYHGFLATPAVPKPPGSAVPEPPGFSVLGIGLIGAGMVRRRRARA